MAIRKKTATGFKRKAPLFTVTERLEYMKAKNPELINLIEVFDLELIKKDS